jgi:hypothetical protein
VPRDTLSRRGSLKAQTQRKSWVRCSRGSGKCCVSRKRATATASRRAVPEDGAVRPRDHRHREDRRHQRPGLDQRRRDRTPRRSRSRWITPDDDNFGFAAWVEANRDELLTLGPGRHFGEWWGSGIQRGYGLPKGEKRFSLFNVSRWGESRPACCHVVPVLY